MAIASCLRRALMFKPPANWAGPADTWVAWSRTGAGAW